MVQPHPAARSASGSTGASVRRATSSVISLCGSQISTSLSPVGQAGEPDGAGADPTGAPRSRWSCRWCARCPPVTLAWPVEPTVDEQVVDAVRARRGARVGRAWWAACPARRRWRGCGRPAVRRRAGPRPWRAARRVLGACPGGQPVRQHARGRCAPASRAPRTSAASRGVVCHSGSARGSMSSSVPRDRARSAAGACVAGHTPDPSGLSCEGHRSVMSNDKAAEAREGLFDNIAGKAKEVAGAVSGKDGLVEEGQLQQARRATARKRSPTRRSPTPSARRLRRTCARRARRRPSSRRQPRPPRSARSLPPTASARASTPTPRASEQQKVEGQKAAERKADELAESRLRDAEALEADATSTEQAARPTSFASSARQPPPTSRPRSCAPRPRS